MGWEDPDNSHVRSHNRCKLTTTKPDFDLSTVADFACILALVSRCGCVCVCVCVCVCAREVECGNLYLDEKSHNRNHYITELYGGDCYTFRMPLILPSS